MMKKVKPLIGITMGDAGGIGPEVICKMVLRKSYVNFCDIVIIGNRYFFEKTVAHYRYPMRLKSINATEDVYSLNNNEVGIIDVGAGITVNNFKLGSPFKEIGKIALLCIDKAVELAKTNKIDAIVTAPVNKELIALTYKNFIGHTEYIANKVKANNFNMMMVSSKMKVVLVTTHLAIKQVPKNVTKIKVKNTIKNAFDLLTKLRYKKPRIAVLGLNPHCGDGGLFGNEEEKIIIPVIEELKNAGIPSDGPFAADSFFFRYEKYPIYDAIVAMYHDQGLIPFKTASFSNGINATIGLPIVRTSVDHGTGYDIAGKNIANDRSLFEALKFAYNLCRSV